MKKSNENGKRTFAVWVVLLGVIAMALGGYVFLWDEGERELSPEELAARNAAQIESYQELQGQLSLAMENRRDARHLLPAIRELAAERSDDVQMQLLLAQAELFGRRYQAAYDAFEKALAIKPDQYQVQLLTGTIAYEYLNDVMAARKHYEAARLIQPLNPRPLLYLAQLDLEAKDYVMARKLLDEAIALDPLRGEPYAMLSDLDREEGKTGAAMVSIQKAIELAKQAAQGIGEKKSAEKPVVVTYVLKYVGLLKDAGRYEDALVVLDELPASERVESNVMKETAAVWLALGKPEQAGAYFKQILVLDPANETAAGLAARCYLDAGDVQSARWMILKLRQINPESEELKVLDKRLLDIETAGTGSMTAPTGAESNAGF
ncbi:tetratricopeptide repeat protein [Poriferisphaera sp. WC338]|uniref:tetratricopeptide repeat protein n=1 Tax=Poriferisphaera sp. WC338 TaxID=3425129 RepID=UPI003D81BD65